MAFVVDVLLVGAERDVTVERLEPELRRILGELPDNLWRSLQSGPVCLKSKLQRHEADRIAAAIQEAGGMVRLQMVPLVPAGSTPRKRATTEDVEANVEVAEGLVNRLDKLSERLTGYAGRSLPPAELEAVREALTAAQERADEFPDNDRRYRELRGRFNDLCYTLASYLPAAERPKFAKATKAASKKAGGGRGASRRTIVFLVIIVLLVGARVALFFVGSDHDKRLEPPKHLKVKGTGPGVATAVAPQSAAVTKALNAGNPVVAHVRLMLQQDGSLLARAVALDPKGSNPKVSYTWYEDGKKVVEEMSGVRIASDVKRGSTYVVEVIASAGGRASTPLRSGPLQVPMGK
ncbi:MAG: hypothetical protein KC503_25410 [Myxococcales bacterium]|nr:hypothetical protein [Myxococcales bacterium]